MLENAFQLREFYSLSELEREWGVHTDTLNQWLGSGHLAACVWLPVRSVYLWPGESHSHLEHFEGYVSVGRDTFRRVLRQGTTELRHVTCLVQGKAYTIPDSGEGVFLKREDCVVLSTEKGRFEEQWHQSAQNTKVEHVPTVAAPCFRHFSFQGECYAIGELQAAFIHQLYQAVLSQEPWQHGKQVLGLIGSRSFRVADLFRHQPRWRDWIESDGRGGYRLSPEFLKQMLG